MTMAAVESYRIVLDGVRFRGRHGASRAERDLFQDFLATVEVELPPASLPRSDSLRGVLDYGKLAELVVDEGTQGSYRLLETLAQKILARILADTPAISALVRVKKFGPPTASSVDSAAIQVSGRR